MVETILNNTTPYGKIRASHETSLHSSNLSESEPRTFTIAQGRWNIHILSPPTPHPIPPPAPPMLSCFRCAFYVMDNAIVNGFA